MSVKCHFICIFATDTYSLWWMLFQLFCPSFNWVVYYVISRVFYLSLLSDCYQIVLSDCCSVTWLCPIFCNPTDYSAAGFPFLLHLPEFAQTRVHWVGDPSNHFILCHPLLLLRSIFPSIRIFTNESDLRIRWPKYFFQLQHQSFQWIFRTDFP